MVKRRQQYDLRKDKDDVRRLKKSWYYFLTFPANGLPWASKWFKVRTSAILELSVP